MKSVNGANHNRCAAVGGVDRLDADVRVGEEHRERIFKGE